jgi:hypothetical protein
VTFTTTGSVGLRSAKTSTSTVTELLPTDTTSAWKLTMSPTPTGCLKTKELTATVTTREPARRIAGIAPATSTMAMIQPPKTSPAG